ncbi:MAG: KH domain-containing protein [Actinomycetota bacterium]|nr:MAG: RNA-binding protein [Actinomycetota bacterium]MDO8950903.1 KH domain-containing protein [Actinomycetota bacterium]MDP3629679.1 KH domain-containing protein [Actinomycetota bacterium]
MTGNANLDELVHLLVTSLVDYPDDVKIESKVNEDGTLFEVAVNSEDVGKIIGRQGRVIKAIRTLVRAAASVNGSDAMVEVLG